MTTGLSDPGKRRHQEDAWLVASRGGVTLCAVCEGMGAATSGAPAAELTIRTLRAALEVGSLPEALVLVVEDANREIVARSQGVRDEPDMAQWLGMGSTVEVVVFVPGAAHLAHVGDGRIYRFRAGELVKLTSDHTLEAEYQRLRPPNAEHHAAAVPKGVIVRALGMKAELAVDHCEVDALPGDVFLLCSDGLIARLSDEAIGEVLSKARTSDAAAAALMTAAHESECAPWSHDDNFTVVVHVVD